MEKRTDETVREKTFDDTYCFSPVTDKFNGIFGSESGTGAGDLDGISAGAIRGGVGGLAQPAPPPVRTCAMLDIPTPQLRHPYDNSFRRMLSKPSRRFYSRALLGLQLPGRYYFLTYTTCMDTPHPVGYYWRSLWKWHRRYRPESCCCYGITREGKAKGVIHMIVRLGPWEKRMDVRVLRQHWQEMTGARQIKIVHVQEAMKENLAAYIADQRKKRSLAGEMAWQDYLEKWRWTTGWLPKGFTRNFGRVYSMCMEVHQDNPFIVQEVLNPWLQRCVLNPDEVNKLPIWRTSCKK